MMCEGKAVPDWYWVDPADGDEDDVPSDDRYLPEGEVLR
jgi:hypothetical protein